MTIVDMGTIMDTYRVSSNSNTSDFLQDWDVDYNSPYGDNYGYSPNVLEMELKRFRRGLGIGFEISLRGRL